MIEPELGKALREYLDQKLLYIIDMSNAMATHEAIHGIPYGPPVPMIPMGLKHEYATDQIPRNREQRRAEKRARRKKGHR